MRILFALAGLHRVERGAEIAFTAIASELANMGHAVTLIGSGPPREGQAYRYLRAAARARENFERYPRLPALRGDTAWEELTFLPGLLRTYRPQEYDVTVTCSYPFTNWALRRPVLGGKHIPHVFVTQNGDWPAQSGDAEFRWFGCDGLVCINPDYFERNRDRYRAALIPNGVGVTRFRPGTAEREHFALEPGKPVVLMVSALIPSKNVALGIEAVAAIADAQLVVAGDGALRDELQLLAQQRMPGRYRQLRVPAHDMPALYRSADVFLHLSEDESFGNVFVEAMACGLPVVARDLPRTRWIVGDTAYLAATRDNQEIARQLREGIASPASERELRVRRAANFAWPKIAAQYAEFLSEVVSAR